MNGPSEALGQIHSGNGVAAVPSRRLIVMSNRAPVRIVHEGRAERLEPTVGGVGTTFLRLLERNGGLWIAWSGGQKTPAPKLMPPGAPRFKIVFAPLSEQDISDYYHGMCNRGLWPLMHFMTPKCHFSTQQWNRYVRVNQAFARIASEEAAAGDLLWVQDFHLALVPRLVRQQRSTQPIGIFWHVPYPPEQLMRILPWREEFLYGMLGADVIGFHTKSYATHFLNCCQSILHLDVCHERGEVIVGGRRVHAPRFRWVSRPTFSRTWRLHHESLDALSASGEAWVRRVWCWESTGSIIPRVFSNACSASSASLNRIRHGIGV
jgi:trehalose 6-phosphate synthase